MKEILIMNKTNKFFLWIWIILIILMGLFPPVKSRSFELEYRFFLNARCPVNLSYLVAQWVISSALVGCLFYIFKDKKKNTLEWQDVRKIFIMNSKQKKCLLIGILIIVLMGLFPPIGMQANMYPFDSERGVVIDYSFYTRTIEHFRPILIGHLIVQWVIVSAITIGSIVAFKEDKKPKDEKENK
jgi:hypothetical protein